MPECVFPSIQMSVSGLNFSSPVQMSVSGLTIECLFHAVLFFDPAEMPREDLQCLGQNDSLDSTMLISTFAGFNLWWISLHFCC